MVPPDGTVADSEMSLGGVVAFLQPLRPVAHPLVYHAGDHATAQQTHSTTISSIRITAIFGSRQSRALVEGKRASGAAPTNRGTTRSGNLSPDAASLLLCIERQNLGLVNRTSCLNANKGGSPIQSGCFSSRRRQVFGRGAEMFAQLMNTFNNFGRGASENSAVRFCRSL
jgi:hypothetical protein